MRYIAAFLALTLAACAGHSETLPPAAPSSGVAPAATSSIVFDTRSRGPSVATDVYGAELATWYDITQSWVAPSMKKAGLKLVRFPGGSESDAYHWANGGTLCDQQGYITPQSSFDNLMTKVAVPNRMDVAITLNYGSNSTCNGGGDPNEAAAWVTYAKSKAYNVRYWTLGNENYGSWEFDLHAKPNDPATYADAFRTGFYPAVKAANAQAKLGVVADFDQSYLQAWNDVVFKQAGPFDFVEIHYYPEYETDNDAYLLGGAIDQFTQELTALRNEMTADGISKTIPVYLGEFNNDSAQEGKQSVSIVNGLFLGQMVNTAIAEQIPMATWWLAYGSCDQNGDFSQSLYGWQNFGSEGLFSDGLPDTYECTKAPPMAGGTPYPTARVMTLLAKYVPPGSSMRTVTVAKSLGSKVRAYGYAAHGGYVLAAYNNTLKQVKVTLHLRGGKAQYRGTLATYGKAQYDLSKNNRWAGPVTKRLGTIPTSNLPLLLPAYSLTILSLR
ncbi:MAG TPA: hypothetical protein VFE36_09900 [Candidatus Baltobacteraceae bacterium]|jgi:hypothetical protein|nr:hypothetical protein [Candidatus Baltobacteraceae bacterium]